jgi:hypothetical protein
MYMGAGGDGPPIWAYLTNTSPLIEIFFYPGEDMNSTAQLGQERQDQGEA